MSDLLQHARLKIERANQHISHIQARNIALHKTDASRVEIHPKFGTERLIHEFTDATAFIDFALLLGDAIHNLNCALDYAWWQTVINIVPSIAGDRTKFPVRQTFKELEGWLSKAGTKHAAIGELCPELGNFLLNEIRPYAGGNYAIWPVHVLDSIDKHRLLIAVLSSGDINGIVVTDENGESWPGNALSPIQRPPYVVDLKVGYHFKEKGCLTAWIIVKDGKLTHDIRIPSDLADISKVIARVVDAFEAFFKMMNCS